jgi:hypothetical protein
MDLQTLINIRILTTTLYGILLDVAGVYTYFVLNILMHTFVVHCFVNCLINLLMSGAWKMKSVYSYMNIF